LTEIKDRTRCQMIMKSIIVSRGSPESHVNPKSRKQRDADPPRETLPGTFGAALGAHLHRRGLRHSEVRDLVVEAFLAAREHVSVEDLTRRVRHRGIGQATVYRTLKLLADCGLAAPRQFGDGVTRYEPLAEHAHHDHLICTACGKIVEFQDPRIEALQVKVARRHGFTVESHKLELYGRCAACRRDAPGASA
jgi:Fur family ferric uptake transcriptional regulator